MFNSICASVDKLDKEPWSLVSEELREKGLKSDQIERLADFVIGLKEDQDYDKVLSKLHAM